MSRARVRRRYWAHLRYIYRCQDLGAGYAACRSRAYGRLLDRVWEE